MKSYCEDTKIEMDSPAPQGAGGLKYPYSRPQSQEQRSRPARGGWIEILPNIQLYRADMSRPARGGWIEIPCGIPTSGRSMSRPARGGWIEIQDKLRQMMTALSRPARGGWIEIGNNWGNNGNNGGPAPQGAGGLKSTSDRYQCLHICPAPQGAGGLK